MLYDNFAVAVLNKIADFDSCKNEKKIWTCQGSHLRVFDRLLKIASDHFSYLLKVTLVNVYVDLLVFMRIAGTS